MFVCGNQVWISHGQQGISIVKAASRKLEITLGCSLFFYVVFLRIKCRFILARFFCPNAHKYVILQSVKKVV